MTSSVIQGGMQHLTEFDVGLWEGFDFKRRVKHWMGGGLRSVSNGGMDAPATSSLCRCSDGLKIAASFIGQLLSECAYTVRIMKLPYNTFNVLCSSDR